ncbi:phosphate regulon sensor histidine kinase PhoR [Methyloversatilis thermotolerans]|uniref:phosphate regulon sensor histidine kinase PhoR n=1 Tax=Methyloversatilis thermotolerans TaxID=1346290 RepID=UPI000381EE82|nr:phosphate regulon sensor histidine kinase PhoR [Methyloversatilis thermotolerans]
MREFWIRAVGRCIVLLLGLLFGYAVNALVPALVIACLVLLFGSLRDQYEIVRFDRWLSSTSEGEEVPDGAGQWEFLFAKLARRERTARQLREDLRSRLERMREASRAMPDGALIMSRDELIEWLNPKAEEHLGLDGRRDLGMPVLNLLRQPEFSAYLESGEYSEPLTMPSPRHPGRTLQLLVVPFGDDQRLLLTRDVTQLEKLETMRRDFVANVSHEMKTPLTVIHGFLETLEDGLQDLPPEQSLSFIRMAQQQSIRMQRLVDDLLTLSALETDTPAQEEVVDMRNLLDVIAVETRALSSGRHTVSLQVDGAPGGLLACARDLRSALGNLASNAVRYTPDGGRVTLRWHIEPDGGGMFSVSDNGIGIAAQHIPRLTERFYRVDRGRSRETGGTGLGLAIVKHVLERHQATLHVESQPGVGSTFTVRFPPLRTRRQPEPALAGG